MQHFFTRYDLLLTPTMPTTAFAAGVPIPSVVAGRPTIGFGYTPLTFPFNLTGQPAITVPCGIAADGLPVGLQIVGRRYADGTVLRATAAFEAARPWADRMPSFLEREPAQAMRGTAQLYASRSARQRITALQSGDSAQNGSESGAREDAYGLRA
jgi:aspartyl-tRNA(Asn)/glutamyl-tRNA(Gln) amidotransferase subunit A